jgi:Spherulation-specific family 4
VPALTVTATQSGTGAANGMLLRVLVLDNATLAGTPATAIQSGAAAHQASITTTTTGSVVYGAIADFYAGTVPMDTGCNDIDNEVDTVNGACYATYYTNTTGTPGAETVGTAASYGGGMAAVEVLASGGSITTDASSPNVITTTSAQTLTSATFTPPAGTLLVALVSTFGVFGDQVDMTVSGGGLTWTQQASGNTASNGYVGVWTAVATSGTETQYILAPVYSYPPSSFWTAMIDAAPTVAIIVCNVDNGPGAGYESNFGAIFASAAGAGILCAGYVYTSYGARSAGDCETDINNWYTYYGITSILFDEVEATTGNESYYSGLVSYVHSAHAGAKAILNPGDIPAQAYLSTPIGDIVIVCEDSDANFPGDAAAAPSWLFDYPASRIGITVNQCASEADMVRDIELAASAFNAKYVWVTSDGIYGVEPPYFTSEIAYLGGGSSPTYGITVTSCGSGGYSPGVIAYDIDGAPLPQEPEWRSLQVPVTNTGGDWMVAIVGWTEYDGDSDATVMVGDDVHNWWEPLGVPTAASPDSFSVCAVWVAPAARAASYVTVAPVGSTAALAVNVLDIAGMTPWVTVTGVQNEAQVPAETMGTISLPAPSSQALVITCCASNYNPYSGVTVSGSGWTSLSPVQTDNGTDHVGDLTLSSAYQVTTGSASATWGGTGYQDMAADIVGVLTVGVAPFQVNPMWPVTIAEIAPGFNAASRLDNALQWTAITPRSLTLAATQGRQYQLAQLQTGAGTVDLDNPDGALIPPGSGDFAGIDSGTPFRVRTIWQGGAWQISFTGNGSTANPQVSTGAIFPVIPGVAYSCSAYLACSVPYSSGVAVLIVWWTSANVQISSVTSAAVTGIVAGLEIVSGTAPGTAAYASVVIQAGGTPSSTVTFFAAAAPLP